MINTTTTQTNRIPAETKLKIALEAIKRDQPITAIAKNNDCSRNSVYAQQEKALSAVTNAFTEDPDEVLFYVPMTKSSINEHVASLFLTCKASYRDIKCFFMDRYNYTISIGGVHNILMEFAVLATEANDSYDLSGIQTSASDEVFHQNEPINTTVDIASRFCAQAIKAGARDGETWSICLLLLMDQGYKPGTTVIDGASGLLKGYTDAMKSVTIRHDHFHIIRDILNCVRYLFNKEKSAATKVSKLQERATNGRNEIKKAKAATALVGALGDFNDCVATHQTFKLLAGWLQHDVLQLAGYEPVKRAELYDFILSEVVNLGLGEPNHRIDAIIASLKFQRDGLLDVATALNLKFNLVALEHKIPLSTVWDVCYLARYGFDSCKYQQASTAIEILIGEHYEAIENAVLHILDTTHRCSSMVENFHSRLHPYLAENKILTQKTLDLIRFYLNHKPFMRSAHSNLVGKSPAEALTGKPHQSWLRILGSYRKLAQAA
jgi:hypothetical protein